jgi:DDE superfamily endonuclease
MWPMIPSLDECVTWLTPVFTQPSFVTHCHLVLAWVMCLGHHNLARVARTVDPQAVPDHSQRHGLDPYYNFFERSAWTPKTLAYHVLVFLFTRLKFVGRITLLVDDTLSHKRGKSVWGLGWFREAVASTKKRVATAAGHNWVIVAVAVCLPVTHRPILALPLLARLHRSGSGQASCVDLARDMLGEVLAWFPERTFALVGDGAYASKGLLEDLDGRVTFVGRMRGDAAVYDPQVPLPQKKRPGKKATKGARLPSPKAVASKADQKGAVTGPWWWRRVSVWIYGYERCLKVCTYKVVWPRVLGLRPILVVVVRDPEGRMKDAYLFTTDLTADPRWVITMFAWRWAIEVLFRASKQVLEIEAPQHWSQESVEKLAPWVWSMQSVIMVWYITVGHELPEAKEMRAMMGDWDSEWSLRHMIQVLRRAILNEAFNHNSANEAQLREMVQTLKNWVNLAA